MGCGGLCLEASVSEASGAANGLFWGWGADHTGVFSLRQCIELIDALLCMYIIKSFKIKWIISLREEGLLQLHSMTQPVTPNNNDNSNNNKNNSH